MIYVFILFGCLISVNIYAYSPFLPAERRPPPAPPQPASRTRSNAGGTGARPTLSRSNGNSNFGADNRIIQSNPAPPIQRSEERPGVYHIRGINNRIREEEELVVANVIPQSVAEPLNNNNNRFIENIRLIMTGKSRNNQETPTTVELESGDQVGPLAQLHDEQGRPPISVRARRIWWF